MTVGTAPPVISAPSETNPFAEVKELSLEALVEQILARNPSLVQMTAAWQAASAKYPQVISWDDPQFGATFGPGSLGSNAVEFAYRLEVSQKIPFPGKLGLRGLAAQAEAGASGRDVEAMRLQLIESAKDAYYEFFLADRAQEVNAERLKRLNEFRQNALARVKNNQAPQQDILQADVEIANQGERQLELEQMRNIVIARLNTLMHLAPANALPPPAKQFKMGETLPDAEVLRHNALARRPDLQALSDRIVADQAALALAYKEYYPDFEVMAAYDAFWQGQDRDLRSQVGVRVNLPIRKTRRSGAVAEAQARLAQRRAELDRLTDQVNFQVQEAYEKVRKSMKVVGLYDKTTLPAAEANVKEAQTAYINGKIPFLSLVEAQRNHVNQKDRYYEAVAEYFRRSAALERVIGGPLATLPAMRDPK